MDIQLCSIVWIPFRTFFAVTLFYFLFCVNPIPLKLKNCWHFRLLYTISSQKHIWLCVCLCICILCRLAYILYIYNCADKKKCISMITICVYDRLRPVIHALLCLLFRYIVQYSVQYMSIYQTNNEIEWKKNRRKIKMKNKRSKMRRTLIKYVDIFILRNIRWIKNM